MLKLNPLSVPAPKLALAACALFLAAVMAAVPENPGAMFQLSLTPLERVSTLPDPEAGTYATQDTLNPHPERHRAHDRHPGHHSL